MNDTATRRYTMTRLAAGDYLWPSNDGGTLWRAQRYYEDGSLVRDDGSTVVGAFWRLLSRPMPPAHTPLEDVLDVNGWNEIDALLNTRAQALSAAARREGR